jgi:predicted cupin superfamily sugar epimerase
MNSRSSHIIEKLELEPHPEGGYFRETYRSSGEIEQESLGSNFDGNRNYSTCIYFLLTSNDFSAFHRIKQDEIWHFYDGSPIQLHVIAPSGEYTTHLVGREIDRGERPQHTVPAGCWFAAEVINESAFSLFGCTVSPGFDFRDFEMGSRSELISLFPGHEKIISKLTRD